MDLTGAQHPYGVRFEWGPTGGLTIAQDADVVVVVDVISGSTAVVGTLVADATHPVPLVDETGFGPLVGALDEVATTVVVGCLRNAQAVADWLAREHDPESTVVAVVAVGETWPDGTLRPAAEDLWGAGAILAALEDLDWAGLSPEAAVAADAYRLIVGREQSHLLASSTGEAFRARGESGIVADAAEISVDSVVPILSSRGFVPAP